MLKLIICILTLQVSLFCNAQKYVYEYKNAAEKEVKKYFQKSVFKKIKYDGYYVQGHNIGEGYSGNRDSSINKKIPAKYVLIFFLFDSKQIDYEFSFYVSIDSSMNLLFENRGIDDIPSCLSTGKRCNYIKKKNAVNIALGDSIKYPENLLAEFKRNKKNNKYYWVISGQDKNNVNYSIKNIEGWQVFPKTKDNTRIVDAISGNILEFSEFEPFE